MHSSMPINNSGPSIEFKRESKSNIRSPSITGKNWSPLIRKTSTEVDIAFALPPSSPRASVFEARKESFMFDSSSVTENIKPNLQQQVTREVNFHDKSDNVNIQEVAEYSGAPFKNSRSASSFNDDKIGIIQPKFYNKQAESIHYGSVCCSLMYDGAVETLTVKILKIKQLLPRPSKQNKRDRFVRVFLLPDEINFNQTATRQKNNNPTVNEEFHYTVSNSSLLGKTLRFSVYDQNKKSSSVLLGHALISMDDIDFTAPTDEIWRDLKEACRPGDPESSIGNIEFSLSYSPLSKGRLKIFVSHLKDLNLINVQATGVYVKISIYLRDQVLKSKKTSVKPMTSATSFNELFAIKINQDHIKETSVNVSVMGQNPNRGFLHKTPSFIQKSLLKEDDSDHVFGHVTLGACDEQDDMQHWSEMIARSGRTVAKWHVLQQPV